MPSALFPSDAFEFFRSLGENNNREYFTAHRATYDSAVRGPLEDLTAAAEVKYGQGKVTRPNRDVRFSNDKSPYRLDASMWAGTVGAVYLRVSANGILVGGGLYEPTRDQLTRARDAIAHKPAAASRLTEILARLDAEGFEAAGPSLTTAPRGYDRDDPNIELLRLKRYAALTSLPQSATRADVDTAWNRIGGLNDWVMEHIGAALSWP